MFKESLRRSRGLSFAVSVVTLLLVPLTATGGDTTLSQSFAFDWPPCGASLASFQDATNTNRDSRILEFDKFGSSGGVLSSVEIAFTGSGQTQGNFVGSAFNNFVGAGSMSILHDFGVQLLDNTTLLAGPVQQTRTASGYGNFTSNFGSQSPNLQFSLDHSFTFSGSDVDSFIGSGTFKAEVFLRTNLGLNVDSGALSLSSYSMSAGAHANPISGSVTVTYHYGPLALPPTTHVLCVGMRDRSGKELRGDVMAERVKDAFAQIPSVKTGWLLPLDAQASDSGQNYIQIRDTIKAIRNKMNEGDTFVFFIECHGAYDHNVCDGDNYGGDERRVSAQYVKKVGGVPLYLWNDTTGDEYWELGNNDLFDDDFSGYFTGSEWANINKLFILDTCFSGGFAGSTEYGDTGDLSRLPRFALMAAAPETHFAGSHYDSEAGGQVGNMGAALVNALNQLKDHDSITYEDLWQLIQAEAGLYVGSTGSILGFEDGWDSEFKVDSVDMYSTMSSDFEMSLGIPEPATVLLLALGGLAVLRRRRG